MSQDKIAFVASGGGMSCAYGAGVAQALQDGGVHPDIFIGSSGSAGTVSYFACGEAERAARLWIEEVTNPQVLQRNPLRLNVDLIVDSMRDRFPFDQTKLRRTNKELFLRVTDYDTLETRYISSSEGFDWYDVMRASMAIPFVYGKQVTLSGHRYFDGDVSSSLEQSITFAIGKGATTVYVCDTRSKDSFIESLETVGLNALVTRDFVKTLRGLLKKDYSGTFPANVRIIRFQPSDGGSRSLENDLNAIRTSIDRGHSEATAIIRS